MNSERVAQCAVLAMLFELSSSPKPGNVDRCHDFADIGFNHFLISTVSAYPIFRKAASGEGSTGSLILEAVQAWKSWNIASNTHFGSLVLMIPIAIAAGRPEKLPEELADVLERTTAEDAIDFYSAFDAAKARVVEVDNFSLNDKNWQQAISESGKTLLDLMRLSAKHDIVAREWATNYQRSFLLAKRLEEQIGQWGQNEGIVRTFLEALAEVPDSLICAKFGEEMAREISKRAGDALQDETLARAHELDEELLAKDINPGSTADLIAASLFISLLGGLRF
ncbi:MAG: triphosphoribosyl-dephospho-CoA synthase [Methanosaeta sp. PtaU1.Bin112]|nr:MAG: triphosphoribosyl-dephospho-CoA synthase [Methanosaeta sp. PtaU1.Bin112]